MNLLNFYRSIRHSDHPERLKAKGRKLVLWCGHEAMHLFHDKRNRELLRFEQVDEEEQNRFFNEFVANNLVMAMLLLDKLKQATDDPYRRHYLARLREELPKYYLAWLKELGIADQYVTTWEKVIEQRYDEYSRNQIDWRQALVEWGAKHTDPEIVVYQTVASGLYDHLRRGKIKKGDELFRRLQRQLMPTYLGILKRTHSFF